MKVIRHLKAARAKQALLKRGSVVTIGNFDGVHLGHQTVFKQMRDMAKTKKLYSVVISFQPTPQTFFGQRKTVLTNFREKYQQLKQLNIDFFCVLPFNQTMAEQSADDFVRQLLVAQLNMRWCFIGQDFRFGRNRQGDINTLRQLEGESDFGLSCVDLLSQDKTKISSSMIRDYLAKGMLTEAKQQLGRHYAMVGRVRQGDKRGRTIGFPTLNIALKRQSTPLSGVFVVWLKWAGKLYQAVANIGVRPTVDGTQMLLEVHVFNFDTVIYQQFVTVFFIKKIRDEMSFASLEALTAQIKKDKNIAEQYFTKHPSSADVF